MPPVETDHAAVVARLAAAGCVAAAEEAAELLAASPDAATTEAWLQRREQGEPLPWITGTTEFCGRAVHVDAGLYVPRRHSEELARRVVTLVPAGGRLLDLCTGTGAVAAHVVAKVPTSVVIGVDVDLGAARCARRNGVPTLVGDLDAPLLPTSPFDVVSAVAPYVPTDAVRLLPADVQRYEPRLALDGGRDGLHLVTRVVEAAGRLLRPGGWLVIEVGGDQDALLAPTLARTGFAHVDTWQDDDGDLRGIAARLAP